MATTTGTTFGVVGGGWRAEFFVRLAALMPDRLTLVGAAVRRPERAAELGERWNVPVYLSPSELVAKQRPDFVISSVPWPVNPEVVATLAQSGTRVLSETPRRPTRTGCDGCGRRWAPAAWSRLPSSTC